MTTPKPAAQPTLKRTPRTEIERRPPPEKASVLPWVVAMIALVITSVVGTAWYLARSAKPALAADATTVATQAPPPAAGTDIAVTPPAPGPSEGLAATATIVDLSPAAAVPSGSGSDPTQPAGASPAPSRVAPLIARDDGTGGPGAPPVNASNSELADYYYEKGLSHLDRRQPVDAYESFRKVVTLEPANATGWVRTGELALLLKGHQEAMTDFKKAAQIGEGLNRRDALTAEFGRAIVDGDVAAMDETCRKAPFDRLYNELRRAATRRGATDCPAPIGVGLEGGRGAGVRPGSGSPPPPKPIRRP